MVRLKTRSPLAVTCRTLIVILTVFCLVTSAASPAMLTQSALGDDKPMFHWVDDEAAGTADLLYGDQPVVRYMYAYDASSKERLHETYKVYHHVFGPGTETLITKGPGGLYTHHRGLFVGWNKTSFDGKTLDFWHCTKGAHLRHIKFLGKEGDADRGAMTAEIHWNDAQGKPVIVENRSLEVTRLPLEDGKTFGWQIDWKSTLNSQRGDIRLDGDRQHAGFQFRAAQSVAEAKSARYIRPANFPQDPVAIEVGDKGNPPRHINLNWFAMTSDYAGQPFTVEYLEDPALPKPSLYSERPYGRFGAFFKTTLTADNPLTMRYRVNVVPGKAPSTADVQARYDRFVSELSPQAE